MRLKKMNHTDRNWPMAWHWGVSTNKSRVNGRGTLINIGREIGLILPLIDTWIVIELPGVIVMRPRRHGSGEILNGSRYRVVFVEAVYRVHNRLSIDEHADIR
jgi:hypothetical protein